MTVPDKPSEGRDSTSDHGLRGEIDGLRVVVDFGEPVEEFEVTARSAGVVERPDLSVARMWGRDPRKMLNGLATNDVLGLAADESVYGAILTPKGRIISDFESWAGADDEIFLIYPTLAQEALRAHLGKYVPPMFARWNMPEEVGVVGVYGPSASHVVGSFLDKDPEWIEGHITRLEIDQEAVTAIAVNATGQGEGWNLVVPTAASARIWDRLSEAVAAQGGRVIGFAAYERRRIEQGRPRFGREITEDTMPAEVYGPLGEMDRAVSFKKGCYTGQEVVVRLAHRGHVNRSLRGLVFADAPFAEFRSPLFASDTGKEVGWVTSVSDSPSDGKRAGMGYVRREIAEGDSVRVGAADGPQVTVTSLPPGSG